MKNKIMISFLGLSLLGYANEFYYEKGKKVELTEITSDAHQKVQNTEAIRYYKTERGQTVGVTQDILVECKEGVECRKVLSEYEMLEVRSLTDSIYIVTIAKDQNVFVMSQKLYENSNVKMAHPNFIKEKKRR